MEDKELERWRKKAIPIKIDQKDIDQYEEGNKQAVKRSEEIAEKEKLEYLEAIYDRLVGSCEEIDDEDKEEKRVKELFASDINGELNLSVYIKSLDDDDVCYSLATLLFDCQCDGYSNYLLEVLSRSLSRKLYIAILEAKYLGNHDT